MKNLCFFLFSILSFPLLAQDTLTAASLRHHAHSFVIENNEIKGSALSVWQELIQQSHFLLLGEKHQSSQLGYLTAALLPDLAKAGYGHFALEVGPNAAERLEDLATPPANTFQQMQDFTNQYANKLFFKMPIYFFHGYEDALFLQKAMEHGFNLWGLDQELYFSVEFLLDDLLELAKNKPQAKQISKLHQQAVKRYKWFNFKDDIGKKFQRNCSLLTDEKINAYFEVFTQEDEQAQKIITALRRSWQIYCHYEEGQYDKNNQSRAVYMKENFDRAYETAKQSQAQPKFFAKMGDMHLTSGTTRLGVKDIGNHIFNVAKKEDLQAINIRHLRRFYKTKKKVIDYETSQIEWVKYWRPYISLGKKEEWILIDLRPFREALKAGRLKTSKWVADDILHYDFILISPEDQSVTPIWK